MKKQLSEQNISVRDLQVHGIQVDENTRCAHYSSKLDIIAIKFKCCNQYFACHSCHYAVADHETEYWKNEDFHIRAILCGHCKIEMTIDQYLSSDSKCLNCKSQFNPKCKAHWNLYFEPIL